MTIAIPIVIFGCGVLINWGIKKSDRYKERQLIKNTIVLWIDKILNSIDMYLGELNSFSVKLRTSTVLGPHMFNRIHIPSLRLASFSIDRLTDALVLNLKANKKERALNVPQIKLFNYCESVDFLTNAQQHISERYDEYYKYCNKTITEWNNCSQLFLSDLNLNLTNPLHDESTKQFYQDLIKAKNCFAQNDKGEITTPEIERFFEQIEKINDTTPMINPAMVATSLILRNMKLLLRDAHFLADFAKNFERYMISIVEVKERLIDVKEYYNCHKIKRFSGTG
jgi:hypothetical protein